MAKTAKSNKTKAISHSKEIQPPLKEELQPPVILDKKRASTANNNWLSALNIAEANFYEALTKVGQVGISVIDSAEKEYAQGEKNITSAKQKLLAARTKVTQVKEKLQETKTDAVKEQLKRAETDAEEMQTELDTVTTQTVLAKDMIKRAKGIIKKFAALEKIINKFGKEYGNGGSNREKISVKSTKINQKAKPTIKKATAKDRIKAQQDRVKAQQVANELFTEMSAGILSPHITPDE